MESDMTWQPIASAPLEDKFLAAVPVNSIKTLENWWQIDIIWLDDETGDVHRDCDSGWSIDSYTHWMPLPAPPAIEQSNAA